MKGYIMVGTNDLVSSSKFYDTLLGVIGLKAIYTDDTCTGYAHNDEDDVEFYITKPANGNSATGTFATGNPNDCGIYFGCMDPEAANYDSINTIDDGSWEYTGPNDSREKVEKFHKVGTDLGGKDEGLPGIRPVGGNVYYAYVRDLDGNKICAYTNSEV